MALQLEIRFFLQQAEHEEEVCETMLSSVMTFLALASEAVLAKATQKTQILWRHASC